MNLGCKILVCESSDTVINTLKIHFSEQGFTGLLCHPDNVMGILEKNTDLGAVFVSNGALSDGQLGTEVAKRIHAKRPELPIFLRNDDKDNQGPSDIAHFVSSQYNIDDLDALDTLMKEHLFTTCYPIPLVRGIQEISQESFCDIIDDVEVSVDRPYFVKDKIIFGELLSLIPLESSWCRGYMMLQTTQEEVLSLIHAGHTKLSSQENGFRIVNELLNEATNLMWGKIKSRFMASGGDVDSAAQRFQVPIIVNHGEKYISFGSSEPQLCFQFILKDKKGCIDDITIYQKIVFNMSWDPETFEQYEHETNQLVDCGELELF